MYAYSSDPRVTRYLFFGPRDEDSTTDYLEGLLASQRERPRTRFELAVEEIASGRVIGACDLSFIERNVVDLGYMLGIENWGKGFATEIALALVDAAFFDLRADRVISTVDVNNARLDPRAGENRHALGSGVSQAPPRQEPLVGLPPVRAAARGLGSVAGQLRPLIAGTTPHRMGLRPSSVAPLRPARARASRPAATPRRPAVPRGRCCAGSRVRRRRRRPRER